MYIILSAMFDTNAMNSQDKGVSPVIGVILMVAITVILAAVIGTFVLDLAGSVEQNPQASVTFSQDASADTVEVQAISMQNADSLTVSSNGGGSWDTTTISNVGDTATYTGTDGNSGTVTVTATLDGNSAVIQTFDYSL